MSKRSVSKSASVSAAKRAADSRCDQCNEPTTHRSTVTLMITDRTGLLERSEDETLLCPRCATCPQCAKSTSDGRVLIKNAGGLICEICVRTRNVRWCVLCEEYHKFEQFQQAIAVGHPGHRLCKKFCAGCQSGDAALHYLSDFDNAYCIDCLHKNRRAASDAENMPAWFKAVAAVVGPDACTGCGTPVPGVAPGRIVFVDDPAETIAPCRLCAECNKCGLCKQKMGDAVVESAGEFFCCACVDAAPKSALQMCPVHFNVYRPDHFQCATDSDDPEQPLCSGQCCGCETPMPAVYPLGTTGRFYCAECVRDKNAYPGDRAWLEKEWPAMQRLVEGAQPDLF